MSAYPWDHSSWDAVASSSGNFAAALASEFEPELAESRGLVDEFAPDCAVSAAAAAVVVPAAGPSSASVADFGNNSPPMGPNSSETSSQVRLLPSENVPGELPKLLQFGPIFAPE